MRSPANTSRVEVVTTANRGIYFGLAGYGHPIFGDVPQSLLQTAPRGPVNIPLVAGAAGLASRVIRCAGATSDGASLQPPCVRVAHFDRRNQDATYCCTPYMLVFIDDYQIGSFEPPHILPRRGYQ